LATLRDRRLLAARERWFARMRGLFAGEPQPYAFVLNGIQKYTEDSGPWKLPRVSASSLLPT